MHDNAIKILIAEDNQPTRHLLMALVAKAGYQGIEARNGEEALDKLRTEKPDLILLDLQMEPVGGLRFMRRMIGSDDEVPTLLVTGDPSIDILEQANKLGMAGVIRKPVDEKKLLSNIERTLAKKRS